MILNVKTKDNIPIMAKNVSKAKNGQKGCFDCCKKFFGSSAMMGSAY